MRLGRASSYFAALAIISRLSGVRSTSERKAVPGLSSKREITRTRVRVRVRAAMAAQRLETIRMPRLGICQVGTGD